MAAVLLFAMLIKAFGWNDGIIAPGTQIIKILGIGAAVLPITSGRGAKNGWIRGLIAGTLYILLGFAVFGAISGRIPDAAGALGDIGLGAAAGAIIGIIGVNIRKKGR